MYGSQADEPQRLLDELHGFGVRAAMIEADLAAPDCGVTVMDAAEAALGPISILVCNAAYSTHDNVETIDAASIDAHYHVNTRATALLTAEFARRFSGQHGRVITFSSGQHLGPMPDELSYAMSKGAIIAFTQSVSQHLVARGITANVINPGATDTGWISDEFAVALRNEHPAHRIGMPEDAARAIAWLTSEEAFWINGQLLNSEGMFRG
jgi:3-oxoacyl-[acyl-carrier protein] reductase